MAKQDKDMLYSFFDYYFYFNDVNETTKLKSKHTLATEIVDFFVRIRGYERESLVVLVENEIPGYFLHTSREPNYFDELKKNEPVMPAIPATAFQGMIKRDAASLGSLTTSKWLRQAEQGYRQIGRNKKQIVAPTIQDYLVNRLVTPGRAAAALVPRERRKEFGQMIKTQVFDKKKTLPPRIDDLFEPPETLVPIQRFEHMEKELYMAIRLQKDCLACLRLSGFVKKKNTPNISFNLKLNYNDDDTDLLIQLRWERTSIFGADTTTRDPSVSTNRQMSDWAREWKQRFPSRGTGNPGTLPGFNPYNNRSKDDKDWEGYSRPSTDVLVDLNTQLDRQKFKTPAKGFNEPPSVLPSDERSTWVTRRGTTHSPGGLFQKPQRVVCSKFEPGCLDDGSALSESTRLKRLLGHKKLWDDKTLLSSRSQHFTWEDAGAAFYTSVGVTDVETSKKFEIFCFSNNKKLIRDTNRLRYPDDGMVYGVPPNTSYVRRELEGQSHGFVLIGPPASYYEFRMENTYENIKDYVVYMCLFILKLCQIIPPQTGDMNTKIETIQHNAVRLLQTYIPEREWTDLLATMTFEPPIYDGGGTKKNKSKKKQIKQNKSKKQIKKTNQKK